MRVGASILDSHEAPSHCRRRLCPDDHRAHRLLVGRLQVRRNWYVHRGNSGGTSTESSPTEATPAPGTPAAEPGRVTFGSNDAGPVTGVACQTEGGVTTITVEATPQSTVVLTDEATPVVKSVSIGEAGSDAASLVYIEGVSGRTASRPRGSEIHRYRQWHRHHCR